MKKDHPDYLAKEVAKILGRRGGIARARKQTAAERRELAAKGGRASAGKKNGRKKKAKKKGK